MRISYQKFTSLRILSLIYLLIGLNPGSWSLDTISKKALHGVYPQYPKINYGEGDEAEMVKRGEYLARVGDCIGCHTDAAANIPAFAGGAEIPTPFGIFYGPNITPDKETGIGKWSAEQFLRAMKEGIAPDGSHYFPVFPYQYFNRVTDADLYSIWAYLKKIPPVKNPNKPNTIPFPLNWRFLQFGWKILYFYPYRGEFSYDPEQSKRWNRGAYLVEGLGHCAMCHTPTNFLGAPKRKYHLTGNFIEGYWAPNISAEGLSRSDEKEIVEVFSKGKLSLGAGAVAGPMAEVNHNSLSKLTPEDQLAIATYLKTVQSIQPIGLPEYMAKSNLARGKEVYDNACAICHQHGQAGAPRIGDSANWGIRVEEGLPTLYRHTLNGYNLMPTMGGCVTCTENEIKAAVDYLLHKSLNHSQLRLLEDPEYKIKPTLLDGKTVYEKVCSVCHNEGNLGAPKLGDSKTWNSLVRKDIDTLIKNTLKGTYRMPPKGGCDRCSTSEIIEAVKYMLKESATAGDYTKW